jgi:hypothetical protein
VTTARPGYDEIILTTPDSPRLCNSRACSRAGRLAQVIVSYGVLNDPGTSPHSRDALWPESWGLSCPMCAACRDDTRQVAVKCRPRLVIRDTTRSPATPQPSRGRT